MTCAPEKRTKKKKNQKKKTKKKIKKKKKKKKQTGNRLGFAAGVPLWDVGPAVRRSTAGRDWTHKQCISRPRIGGRGLIRAR
jgi:hypothetical protein